MRHLLKSHPHSGTSHYLRFWSCCLLISNCAMHTCLTRVLFSADATCSSLKTSPRQVTSPPTVPGTTLASGSAGETGNSNTNNQNNGGNSGGRGNSNSNINNQNNGGNSGGVQTGTALNSGQQCNGQGATCIINPGGASRHTLLWKS